MGVVLVVAAHPDDEWLGVGGTILRHVAAGDSVHVHVEVADVRDAGPRGASAFAISRAAGYSLTLGESVQLGYEVPNLDWLVREIKPDIVYTHFGGDINRDHGLVSEAVRVACRPYSSTVRSLRQYETPSSTEWGERPFVPNLFVDIGNHIEEKMRLLAHYTDELRPLPHPRAELSLRARARYWGQVAGIWLAEPFTVVRETW